MSATEWHHHGQHDVPVATMRRWRVRLRSCAINVEKHANVGGSRIVKAENRPSSNNGEIAVIENQAAIAKVGYVGRGSEELQPIARLTEARA